MAKSQALRKFATTKLTRRLSRSVPYLGAAVALIGLASAIRRKGVVRGSLHSGLDAIPLVGAAKNVAEFARGRDFFPDRPVTARPTKLPVKAI